MTTYAEFLAAKATLAAATGLDVDPAEVHPALKPHQRDAVVWAVRGGRRAIFASFGLGKTLIQLEAVRLTLAKCGRGLIVELNPQYFADGVAYVWAAASRASVPTLFDLIEEVA